MKPDIVVIGSFVQDLTFPVERFPRAGETLMGEFHTGPGGKGSNQAVAACRSGANTAYVGAVGRDAFGVAVRDFYQQEGLQAHLAEYPESHTGAAGILVDATGQNSIAVALGANGLLQPGDIPDGLIEDARMVVCQFESNFDATLAAFRRARAAGVLTVLNPAPMRSDFPRELLALTDVFIPNETELVSLAEAMPELGLRGLTEEALHAMSDGELQSACRNFGVPVVIVTLGKAGSFLSLLDECHRLPVLNGIKVVDTTGAGDAFVGGFSSGMVRFDRDYLRAVRFGTVVAGLSVTRLGTAGAMPREKEILERWSE